MRALGYFVEEERAREGGQAPRASQESLFQGYCHAHAHTPMATFFDTLGAEDQPEYRRMVEFIRQSGVGYLVLLSDPLHLGSPLEGAVERVLELDTLHTQVLCMDESLPDPLQGLLRSWATAAPGAERRQRIRAGMQAKAARGEGLGKPPYGYRVGSEGRLEQVSGEAEVVQRMFRWYSDDELGIRSIARLLNDEGSTTRHGQSWSMVTIRAILRNHVYIGTYTRFGLRIPCSHPSLVTPQAFRRVQDLMQQRSPHRRRARGEPFLLSGLVYCGHCGAPMMGVTRRQVWHRKDGLRMQGLYRYYQCQSRTNKRLCSYHTWRASDLEGVVFSRVREGLSTTEPLGQEETPSFQREHSRAERRLQRLDRRFVESVRRAAAGTISLSHLRVVLAEIKAQRELTQQRLNTLTDAPEGLRATLSEDRRRLLTEWEGLSTEEQRQVLRRLVRRVDVRDEEVDVALHLVPGR